MVTQQELAQLMEYSRVKKPAVKIEEAIKKLVKDGKKVDVEPGTLQLNISLNPSNNTAWKPIVERIMELHPELRGPVQAMINNHHNNTSVDHKEYMLAWRDPGVQPDDIHHQANQLHDKPGRREFVPNRMWRRKKRA
jgi:hypothetical protein